MQLRRDVLARTAWLFIRDQESIYVQLEHPGEGWRLVLHGPGEGWKAYDFSDTDTLITFHDSFERDLVAAGFHLQAVAERRRGEDRRSGRRAGGTDRRR